MLTSLPALAPRCARLDLTGSRASDQSVAGALSRLAHLREVILDGCHRVSTSTAQALVDERRDNPVELVSLQRCFGLVDGAALLALALGWWRRVFLARHLSATHLLVPTNTSPPLRWRRDISPPSRSRVARFSVPPRNSFAPSRRARRDSRCSASADPRSAPESTASAAKASLGRRKSRGRTRSPRRRQRRRRRRRRRRGGVRRGRRRIGREATRRGVGRGVRRELLPNQRRSKSRSRTRRILSSARLRGWRRRCPASPSSRTPRMRSRIRFEPTTSGTPPTRGVLRLWRRRARPRAAGEGAATRQAQVFGEPRGFKVTPLHAAVSALAPNPRENRAMKETKETKERRRPRRRRKSATPARARARIPQVRMLKDRVAGRVAKRTRTRTRTEGGTRRTPRLP